MKKYIKGLLDIFLTITGVVLAVLAAIWGFQFFLPFVIGWFVAMIANPLVRWVERKLNIVRKHTSMVIIIVVIAAIVGLGYLAGAKILQEISELVDRMPEASQGLSEEFQDVRRNLALIMQELPESVRISLQDFGTDISDKLSSLAAGISELTVSWASDFAKRVPGILIGMIFTVLSAYFFIIDRDKILEFGRKHTPAVIQEKWHLLTDNLFHVLIGYVKAQLKIMLVIWVILMIGFFVLGIGYAVPIALFTSVWDMIPFLGTGTILVPWAVFKLLAGDIRTTIGLLIIYGITQLTRRLIEPKLVGDSIGMNPLVTLVFMYIGYKWYGVLGMILAVPVGAIVINFYRMGMFDSMINLTKDAVEDFYCWLKPKQKADDEESNH